MNEVLRNTNSQGVLDIERGSTSSGRPLVRTGLLALMIESKIRRL